MPPLLRMLRWLRQRLPKAQLQRHAVDFRLIGAVAAHDANPVRVAISGRHALGRRGENVAPFAQLINFD